VELFFSAHELTVYTRHWGGVSPRPSAKSEGNRAGQAASPTTVWTQHISRAGLAVRLPRLARQHYPSQCDQTPAGRLPSKSLAYGSNSSDSPRWSENAAVVRHGTTGFPLDRLAEFEGVGVYYAATRAEAQACRTGPVAIVGGGNSAGQAALLLTPSREPGQTQRLKHPNSVSFAYTWHAAPQPRQPAPCPHLLPDLPADRRAAPSDSGSGKSWLRRTLFWPVGTASQPIE
jgi:hypothetical protein